MTDRTIWFDDGTAKIVEKFQLKTGHTRSRAVCIMVQLFDKYQADIGKADETDQAIKAMESYREELRVVQAELQDLKEQIGMKK